MARNSRTYRAAVDAVLERAGRISLADDAVDVVTPAERELARRGACDSRLMAPIEKALVECLEAWTPAQKRAIWLSMETGRHCSATDEDDRLDDDLLSGYIALTLETKLLARIIARLSGDLA